MSELNQLLVRELGGDEWQIKGDDVVRIRTGGDCEKLSMYSGFAGYLYCYPSAFLHVERVMRIVAEITGERYRKCDGTTIFTQLSSLHGQVIPETIEVRSKVEAARLAPKIATDFRNVGFAWLERMRSPSNLAEAAMNAEQYGIMNDPIVRIVAISLGASKEAASAFLREYDDLDAQGKVLIDISEHRKRIDDFLARLDNS
ncbi:MAG: hypothetical protein U0R49_00180 [Fimbriimonadales bacterium]